MRAAAGCAGVALALAWAGRASAQTPAGTAAPASPTAPAPATSPEPAGSAADTQAAAALRAAQELESRMIEIRRQLDALERQRAGWDDVRRRLDEIDGRLLALSRELQAQAAPGGGPSPVRFSEGGVVIRSPDDTFMIRPGARLQALYEGSLASRGTGDPASPDTSGFQVAHAEIIVTGHALGPDLAYRLELDFAEPTPVKDAYVQWRISRGLAVRAGQFRVPFGLERQIWNGYLEFVDVSPAVTAMAEPHDVGLMLLGRPLGSRLQYQLAVLNGGGPSRINDNLDLAYVARVVAAPFGALQMVEGDLEGQPRPRFQVGVSGLYNLVPAQPFADVDGNGRNDNVAVLQGGVELHAVFRGADLQGEWFARREHPGAAAADRSYWAGYVQASYFLLPRRLQVAGRISHADLPPFAPTSPAVLLGASSVDEQNAAVNAYLRGHNAKLQVEYTHTVNHDAVSAPVVHRVQAAAQLAF